MSRRVSAWLPSEEKTELDAVADLPDEDRSTTTRRALREGLEAMRVREAVARYQAGEASVAEAARVADSTHEAAVLAGVLAHGDPADRTAVGVVSEDARLRTLAEGLGAPVTSSFGVVVRATVGDKYLSRAAAKHIVRRIDDHGLGMTGSVREQVVGDIAE